MSITNASIVYPQALATNFYTNALYVGDGGDISGTGQVVVAMPDGSNSGPIAFPGVTNPTGLAFDPAGNL